jgi:putative tricarboxylic transport membrane protein
MNQTVRRDASLALLLISFALTVFIFGADLSMGEVGRMGAGYVPWLVACGILSLGASVGVRALHGWWRQPSLANAREDDRAPVPWRAVISISLSAISFALFIQPAGLVVATVVMVLICTLAQSHSGWHGRLLVAGFLATFAGLLFSLGLGLPIPLFPTS